MLRNRQLSTFAPTLLEIERLDEPVPGVRGAALSLIHTDFNLPYV
ncbi:MAG: hypothetical protein ABFD44_01905 [Anaerolineaceae bacterium]